MLGLTLLLVFAGAAFAQDKPTLETKRAEGEKLLGSMRDYARVQFSKIDKPPKDLVPGCGVEKADLKGDYCRVRNDVLANTSTGEGGLVCEFIKDKSIGYGLITFDWAMGKSTTKWFDKQDELDKAISAFKAKLKKRDQPEPQDVWLNKLQKEFKAAVIKKMKEMDASKAWDFYWTAVLEFSDAEDAYLKLRKDKVSAAAAREQAIAVMLKYYFKARYAATLFLHHFNPNDIMKDYFPINISKPDDIAMLTDSELKNPDIRTYQAAYSKYDARKTKLHKFKTDILKYDLQTQKVLGSKDWEKKEFGDWKKKWEKTLKQDPEFAKEDLKFVKGPDYKPGEQKRWQKYLKEHEAKKDEEKDKDK
jgi:hypothetical protein